MGSEPRPTRAVLVVLGGDRSRHVRHRSPRALEPVCRSRPEASLARPPAAPGCEAGSPIAMPGHGAARSPRLSPRRCRHRCATMASPTLPGGGCLSSGSQARSVYPTFRTVLEALTPRADPLGAALAINAGRRRNGPSSLHPFRYAEPDEAPLSRSSSAPLLLS